MVNGVSDVALQLLGVGERVVLALVKLDPILHDVDLSLRRDGGGAVVRREPGQVGADDGDQAVGPPRRLVELALGLNPRGDRSFAHLALKRSLMGRLAEHLLQLAFGHQLVGVGVQDGVVLVGSCPSEFAVRLSPTAQNLHRLLLDHQVRLIPLNAVAFHGHDLDQLGVVLTQSPGLGLLNALRLSVGLDFAQHPVGGFLGLLHQRLEFAVGSVVGRRQLFGDGAAVNLHLHQVAQRFLAALAGSDHVAVGPGEGGRLGGGDLPHVLPGGNLLFQKRRDLRRELLLRGGLRLQRLLHRFEVGGLGVGNGFLLGLQLVDNVEAVAKRHQPVRRGLQRFAIAQHGPGGVGRCLAAAEPKLSQERGGLP